MCVLLCFSTVAGTLLTVDEVAQWVVHAVQLPQEVADIFRNNMVTGYDFPELAAHQVGQEEGGQGGRREGGGGGGGVPARDQHILKPLDR